MQQKNRLASGIRGSNFSNAAVWPWLRSGGWQNVTPLIINNALVLIHTPSKKPISWVTLPKQ